MSDFVPEHTPSGTANLGQLLESTVHHAKALLQAELSLAKRELSSDVSSALSAVVLLIVGAMFFQAALTTLGVVLVLAFGSRILAVGLVVLLAMIGGGVVFSAIRSLERRKLSRTTSRLAVDAQQVMETVK